MIETKFIATNGIKLQVALAGPEDGEPVFLLHGFPDFWFGWEKQIAALSEQGFRVIAPDQRGFNLSDKPKGIKAYWQRALVADIIGLIDALGYEKINLVGHDFGGVVSWNLATLHPERVKKMAILNAPHLLASVNYNKTNISQKLKSWYVLFFQLNVLPERLVRAFDYAILVKNMSTSLSEVELDRYKTAWGQKGAMQTMINWYRGLLQSAKARDIDYGMIDIPTQIIWGDQDKYLEAGLAEYSLKQCTQGKLTVFEGCGHWVMQDRAEEVSDLLLKHFS